MKKITALIVAVMMLLSLAAIPAFAEVTDADYVQDGWGKERELKEGDRWNIQYLFGRETPANGFSFYGKTSEETKFTPTTYKKGGDGARGSGARRNVVCVLSASPQRRKLCFLRLSHSR